MSGKRKVKLVEVGQFCTMNSSDFAEYGVKRGDVIYIAGDALSPVGEEDPYLLRKLFVAAFMEDGHLLPDKKPFLVDAERLKHVTKARQAKFEAMLEEDFAKKEEEIKGGMAENFGEGPDVVPQEKDNALLN